MHLIKPLAGLALATMAQAKCGDADACVGTEFCTTATFTSPSSTTITTCVPTATCLGVYADCVSGGGGQGCCSTYCAATKCRPTDPEWPGCREDNGPCLADENCCYDNKCIEGLCTRE
ncbi:uncharacterized protein BDW47DRAFT_112576 [Aspergillus candidus]|uniref:Uncharacterized protein n=1 Tax=Aspergillus candidus TaxID=41067 RepID=A0A2I2F0T7_ASPCN|nr:hypothetical protein BDW47DRAFT_112576 [Aspergillus candidus]PLB34228.1 hypothetical protein BDW47DRAFT_112576 [Aspergillus candidus]